MLTKEAFTSATKLTNRALQYIGIAWMSSLFFAATSMAAEEIRQHKIVDDVEIVMSVPHALDSPPSDTESQTEHHLVIWLFRKGTSETIDDAHVTAEVAQTGYAGSRQILKPVVVDGKPAYSGIFLMPGRVAYIVKVQIKRSGESGAIEEIFEYRHHHKLR